MGSPSDQFQKILFIVCSDAKVRTLIPGATLCQGSVLDYQWHHLFYCHYLAHPRGSLSLLPNSTRITYQLPLHCQPFCSYCVILGLNLSFEFVKPIYTYLNFHWSINLHKVPNPKCTIFVHVYTHIITLDLRLRIFQASCYAPYEFSVSSFFRLCLDFIQMGPYCAYSFESDSCNSALSEIHPWDCMYLWFILCSSWAVFHCINIATVCLPITAVDGHSGCF